MNTNNHFQVIGSGYICEPEIHIMKNALIAGASGLVGSELLQLLLNGNDYDKVIAFVRRPMEFSHPRLIQEIVDFKRLTEFSPAIAVTDVFCTLGTTIKKAGSQEAFRNVDHDYVVGMGKLSERIGVQQFLVVSSMGADASSRIFYNRVKGEMEMAVQQLNIPSIFIFRPSLLIGKRSEFRLGERIAQVMMGGLGFLFIGGLKKYRPIPASTVANAMLTVALTRKEECLVLESAEIWNQSSHVG